jgi:hypothetical protein
MADIALPVTYPGGTMRVPSAVRAGNRIEVVVLGGDAGKAAEEQMELPTENSSDCVPEFGCRSLKPPAGSRTAAGRIGSDQIG